MTFNYKNSQVLQETVNIRAQSPLCADKIALDKTVNRDSFCLLLGRNESTFHTFHKGVITYKRTNQMHINHAPCSSMLSVQSLYPILNVTGGGSKDGGLGGRRIRVLAQLGHLPGTGGEPQTPKGTGGTPRSRLVGPWFPGWRLGPSSCGGSSESKPLD